MRAFQPDDFYLSAAELADLIHARELSPVAVVKALADRIGKLNPKLHAFVHLDLEAAAKDAEAKEKLQATQKHKRHGRLFGVPVAVKDDLAVKGMPCRHGSQVTPDTPAEYDDVTVQRLKAEGAIILGKTHEPEFGHKGTTVNRLGPGGHRLATANPWDTTRTAGGSSGGSAAAVAAGLAYAAVGTDIGGSVRIPAACCGVVGLKPTFGVIPRVPSGNAFSLWSAGPITRTAADAALLMRVLARPHPGDRFNFTMPADHWDLSDAAKPPRVLWCPKPFGGPVDEQVVGALHGPLDAAHKEKAIELIEAKSPLLSADETRQLWEPFIALVGVELVGYAVVVAGLKSVDELLKKETDLTPTFAEVVKAARRIDLEKYLLAQAAITTFCEERAVRFFADCDLIATPTLAVTPFDNTLDLGPDSADGVKIDPHLGWTHAWPLNVTGEPAASVPCGWTKSGLPVGLQLVGKRGQDGLVLRTAAALEQVSPWADRRPKLD